MTRRRFQAAAAVVSVLMLYRLTVAFAMTTQSRPLLPDGPGRDAVDASCQKCHAPNVVAAKRKSKDAWVQTVFRMRGLGAEVFDDDVDTKSTYLATHFGPSVNVNKATNQELIDAFSFTPDEASVVVKYRTEHGEFKELEDLLKVPGADVAKIQSQSDNIAFMDVPVALDSAPPAPKKN